MKTMKLKSLLAAIALSSAGSAAYAETYLGADYSFIEAEDVDLGAVALKAGYQLNEWASVEARVGFGVDDDKIGGIKAELNEYYGGYFVAGLPNETAFYPYVIAGVTKGEVKASYLGESWEEDETDFSYGFGSRLRINENISANLEFMRYLDKDSIEFDAVSVGFVFNF